MHIYIHVPFCGRRCSYCDFAIAVRREAPDAEYVAAIRREWRAWSATAPASPGRRVSTLYFGGGTPSRLAPASIAQLVETIRQDVALADDAEVTLEVNPDDVTAASATAWRAAGVNRISLGVQSHDPGVLGWMHRTHQATQVAPAMSTLRGAGLTNISLDLIFALPEELQRDWRDDLHRTIALAPSHLSIYGLTVEAHTPLARWVERGRTATPPDDRYAEEYLLAHALLGAAGYAFYEVSNACRDGLRSRHNSAYWSGAEYLGLGPSAHSFERGVRRWNVREWAEYLRRSEAGAGVAGGEELLDPAAEALEQRYLGLRSDRGVRAAELPPGALQWVGSGWARLEAGVIHLTPEGWLRLDALVAAARDS